MPWISPTQFIKMPRIFGFGPNTTVLTVTDIATGRETPLRTINAVIRQAWGIADDGTMAVGRDGKPTGFPFNSYSARLSPDGRWLLWQSRAEGRPVWTAMTLDGTQRVDWPRHISSDASLGEGGAGWMRDSVHFAEISQQWTSGRMSLRACVYGLDAPGQTRVFPLMPPLMPPGYDFLLPPFPNSDVLFTGDGHGWIMGAEGSRYEIIPGHAEWSLRLAPLFAALDPAISDPKPIDYALSPDGSRLIWHDNPYGRSDNTKLYLSRPDGSEAREIFETSERVGWGSPYCAEWTPDGEGIVIHWHGSNPISNAPKGEGLYLITLSPAEAEAPHDARLALRVTLGPFPTSPGPRPTARLRLAGF